MDELIERALDSAQAAGAQYADIRLTERETESLTVKNGALEAASSNLTTGFGVRVLVAGAWGFAGSAVMTNPEVERFAKDTGGACRNGTLVDGGRLAWSKKLGLVAIWLGRQMATPEGISLASTEAEVQQAYPPAKLQQGYWVVPLGSGLEYEFGFDADGSMSEGLLTSTAQDCFG